MACLGGVRFDWNDDQWRAISKLLDELQREFDSLAGLVQASASTRDRLVNTGIITPETARKLGLVGIAGRASGFNADLRRDFPHAAYDGVNFTVPVYTEGDVQRRVQVRMDEVRQSIQIVGQLMGNIPPGEIRAPLAELPPNRIALGYVEGWRGEIFHWIRTLPGNRLARCKIKDPSLQNWPALAEAVQGNIVPDFPVINKSFNLSYSGTDR
jgi:Ni,Fe-hydrogenase III large subunit